jgi:cytochrome bd-type quinol oxidase subunit 2
MRRCTRSSPYCSVSERNDSPLERELPETPVESSLRYWSFARVLLVSGAWFVVSVAGWLYFSVRGDFVGDEGGGGIGAVSVGINPVMLAIPVVPPIVLILAWLIMRRRQSA